MYLKNCLSFETFQLKSVLKHNSIQNRISLKNIFKQIFCERMPSNSMYKQNSEIKFSLKTKWM